jgi:imidazolonepropionase-like amidohydrolase
VLPGLSLHQELQLFVEAGISPLGALQAATRNAAAARGEAGEGTIAPGQRADLLLVDADPLVDIRNLSRVSAVVAGGRLHDRAALDRLLADARVFAAR